MVWDDQIVTILALIATGIFMVATCQLDMLVLTISGFPDVPKGWVSFVMTFQMVFFLHQAIGYESYNI